jgi:hypothetical protein
MKHRLPRDAAEAVLRQLEPLACRRFDSFADAARWFRDREPATPHGFGGAGGALIPAPEAGSQRD